MIKSWPLRMWRLRLPTCVATFAATFLVFALFAVPSTQASSFPEIQINSPVDGAIYSNSPELHFTIFNALEHFEVDCYVDMQPITTPGNCVSGIQLPQMSSGWHTVGVSITDASFGGNYVAVAITIAPSDWSDQIGADNAPCGDVEVIGVRGSRGEFDDQSPNHVPELVVDEQIQYFMARLREFVRYSDFRRTQLSGRTVSQPQWVRYDAAKAILAAGTSDQESATWSFWALAASGAVGGTAAAALKTAARTYRDSVNQGSSRLKEKLDIRRNHCRSERPTNNRTRFVLAGYSQGAQVIGRAIDTGIDLSDVAAIALLADPTYNKSNAGFNTIPPNGKARGILSERSTPFPSSPKVFSACITLDPVCTSALLTNIGRHGFYHKCLKPDGDVGGSRQPRSWLLAARVSRLGLGYQTAKNGDRVCNSSSDYVDPPTSSSFRSLKSINSGPVDPKTDEETTTHSPVAVLWPTELSVRPGTEVDLSGWASYDPYDEVLEYSWDINGDGLFDRVSDDAEFFHTFTDQPLGPVLLQVRNESGSVATATMALTLDVAGNGKPDAPTGLTVIEESGVVVLSWQPGGSNVEPVVDGYRVEDASTGATLATAASDADSVRMDWFESRTTVSFRVRAFNAAYESDASVASAPFTVVGAEPTGPTGPVDPVDDDAPVITISSPTSGETITTLPVSLAFEVDDATETSEMCKIDQAMFVQCESPFEITSLSNGSHDVVVMSTDAHGNSASATINFRSEVRPAVVLTPPSPPVASPETGFAHIPAIGPLPRKARIGRPIDVPVDCPLGCRLGLQLKIGKKKSEGLKTITVLPGTATVKLTLQARIVKRVKSELKRDRKKKVTLTVTPVSAASTGKPHSLRLF